MRAAIALVACVAIADAAPTKQTIVVCSPGSPGSTDEAKASMAAFAAAASAKAHVPLEAIYDPTEAGGVSKLDSAGIGLVALPFFLEHEGNLKLRPRLWRELPPGTRIVSHWHDMGDWAAQETVSVTNNGRTRNIYLWTVPEKQ